jgi:hypothetical protein
VIDEPVDFDLAPVLEGPTRDAGELVADAGGGRLVGEEQLRRGLPASSDGCPVSSAQGPEVQPPASDRTRGKITTSGHPFPHHAEQRSWERTAAVPCLSSEAEESEPGRLLAVRVSDATAHVCTARSTRTASPTSMSPQDRHPHDTRISGRDTGESTKRLPNLRGVPRMMASIRARSPLAAVSASSTPSGRVEACRASRPTSRTGPIGTGPSTGSPAS